MKKILNLRQKLGSILCVSLLATSVCAISVSASNVDRSFDFNFNGIGNKDQYTSAYVKGNSTSMYFNCGYSGGTYSVIGYGRNDNDFIHDCAYGDPVSIHQGSIRAVPNMVHERGYLYGGIHAYRSYWDGFQSSGKFSPDSTPFTQVY